MNEMNRAPEVGSGYPVGRLAKAFSTALTHHDPRVRSAAAERTEAWRRVVAGMADRTLAIGSRTPVAGMPAWVTPEVLHGGFATGRPAAGGPLRPQEQELAARFGLPADRRALYAHHLTEEGLAELTALLDGGGYELELPEQAALLAVAWLVRAGDTAAALRLLSVIEPFAAELCFTPRPAPGRRPLGGFVYRHTVEDVRGELEDREENPRVSAQQEALAVWNPFADRVLEHWLRTADGGGDVDAVRPDGWVAQGAGLLAEYERLAAEHTRCTKHRRPKENLAILLAALREAVEEGRVGARRRGLLRHAVRSMVRKRGLPGSDRHTALRAEQAAHAAAPSHRVLGRLLSARLAPLPQATGAPLAAELLGPTSAAEAGAFGVPADRPIPPKLRAITLRCLAAPLDDLVAAGLVPSAEVLAELVPALSAEAEAASAPDPALGRLVAANYRAFRNRRSLLLLNLERQVRVDELPWTQELLPHRAARKARGAAARSVLLEVGGAALAHFPGTIAPNPLVAEFSALSRAAGLGLPFTEELAADIFMGEFSPKFLRAAEIAALLLDGGLYARYYGIDYEQLFDHGGDAPARGSADVSPFSLLCRRRAGAAGSGVAAAGMVIEQQQILTTHNLAVLVHAGVGPGDGGWAGPARRAFAVAAGIVERLPRLSGPLGHVKNAAFAWRQAVFFLDRCSADERREVLSWMYEHAAGLPGHAWKRLSPVLKGLDAVLDGGDLDRDRPHDARRFLGWSDRGHWMLSDG
ncbi:transcriptional regulator [Nocardiopsis composta]|uniref:Uncharacterized protein n=1 Tax=Nocardiopsis composta TaxID=157465 RepID=A0A7W8VD58_9ACTN|nr:transcriptional regulator [Nocardiopsis composta]MBB5431648.1 hypothetical protein [Nocardiopsis composta]